MSFFLHIHRFHKRYTAQLTALLAPYELSNSNWSLIHYVASHKTATMSQIAGYWDVEKPTVSANVKALTQRGLLTAVQGEDKREKYLCLTAHGQTLHTAALPVIERFKQQLLATVPAEQQQLIEHAFRTMEGKLKEE